jgi:hypothetical protein
VELYVIDYLLRVQIWLEHAIIENEEFNAHLCSDRQKIPSFQRHSSHINQPLGSIEGDCLRDNMFPMKESNYSPLLKFEWKLVENYADF